MLKQEEKRMKPYLSSVQETLRSLSVSSEGLTAAQAGKRLTEHGANKLAEPKKASLLQRLLKQLADPMLLILIAAAIVSAITSIYAGESFADVIIILAVVIINSVLGVLQESKAEKAIAALQSMTAATCKTLRNGHVSVVRSEEVVPGDIVLLEAGDAVPADGRVLECASLQTEEAALTGESLPVHKQTEALVLPSGSGDVPLGDRKNMVYMGSTVAYGRGKMVVTATGMQTEMGKIARALTDATDQKTPLQKKLSQLSRILTWVVLGVCALIFGLNLYRAYPDINGTVLLDTFMVAVSLAVAAIPEGLAAVVTVVLSIGVTNMSRKHAVIRKLTAVETLGCAQIICSDKTGTLTQNKMSVTAHAGDDEKKLAAALALCSDAVMDESAGQAVGEPTECALVQYAASLQLSPAELVRSYPRIGEAPFDSMRKMMTTVHRAPDGSIVQYTKGAPDVVLSRCAYALQDGRVVPMTETLRARVLADNKRFADQALRVLCAAERLWQTPPASFDAEKLEQNLVYIGLAGMIDPIRPEVLPAIRQCREAGIKPVMITGDHLDTAVAIAMQLGILTSREEAVTGAQLDGMSDEQLAAAVDRYAVYARVQPEHKVRIVRAWQKRGKVTAMTGDGVNDAPSIKAADIGVGMGITGTDVTKNVADMVLADDNFATIVSAVGEGRRIYDNIRKAIQFLLASNLSEVLSIFSATWLGFTVLQPVHLLWINLITDAFPALALGLEKEERNLMRRQPRNPSESIFANGMGFEVVFQGILLTVITLASYLVGHYLETGVWQFTNSIDGMTMAFLTLSMAEIFHSFNMRSLHGSVFAIKGQNRALWGAMALSLLATTLVIYVPGLAAAFGFASISLQEYLVAMGLALSIIPLVELEKALRRAR